MNFKNQSRNLRQKLVVSTACVATIAAFGAPAVSALTEAGQSIQNQAVATYNDSLGNTYTAQSNLASVVVKQVYFATLDGDQTRVAASNQTAYFPHVLTNTGNGPDTFTISVAQDNTTADSGDFSNLDVYIDSNDNGVVDAGEVLASTVTLAAGEKVSVVVAGLIPTATDGQTFGSTLTVTSANGTIEDITTGKGLDGLDGTNEDTVTISGDAVLSVIKSSVHDEENNEITYTVTVSNTGNIAATDVSIFDGIPAGTTLKAGSVLYSGFGTAIDPLDLDADNDVLGEVALGIDINGDNDLLDTSEAQLGIDLDGDGVLDGTGKDGVYGFDSALAPGSSVNLSFTVEYDQSLLGAGAEIKNTAHVSADLDGDGLTNEGFISSNTTLSISPQDYSVDATDTGVGEDDTVNDGGDDDGAANDIQEVATAQAGELVLFKHVITNTGNGTDTFGLDIANQTNFPAGTSYTIWNETGTVQLLNTNGRDGVDTGPMASGSSLTVLVKVQLPSGSGSVAGTSTYDLIATSSEDPSGTPSSNATQGRLLEIVAPTVDLSNDTADNNALLNKDVYNNDAVAVTTEVANPGDSVDFTLVIQNDSQVADSFQLGAGQSFIGGTLGSLPAGWNVTFRDPSGTIVTTTPSIGAGATLTLTATVSIPSTPTQSLADREFVIDDNGNDTVDTNGDGDGDYAIFFRVASVNTGASDIKLDAVDVSAREDITLFQDNSGQIQPGGSIDYPHTVRNDGNTVEAVSLAAVSGTTGWSNNVLIDTDGVDGPDTPFAALTTGDTLYYLDASSNLVAGTLDANGDLSLESGESLPFIVRAFAPTSAPNGQLDIITVTADFNLGADTVTNVDRSEVVNSQLRMTKTASVDASCADIATDNLGPDVGFTGASGTAAPADCVVWQVVATNTGVDTISTIDITDSIPAYSTYAAGTLRICAGNAGQGVTEACTFTQLTDAAADDEGTYANQDIRYTLGQGANEIITNGELASGQSVTVRFSSIVE
ncbi:putative repeat protein (TIGR01451 family) [Litorimonas taeanensis]|uniref:Putative repeat protein (TIGR01451 family) n=1 Tax=Litorimonas taeanensis TaxID=568099 RepID=A0A420WJD7_9PROT|nr:DUF11 domain-containing protein [Litorimonas taeanensis]RKQ71144.1 putative repeat protein (TIGR01451 family) [Litorimonas taeanensis]